CGKKKASVSRSLFREKNRMFLRHRHAEELFRRGVAVGMKWAGRTGNRHPVRRAANVRGLLQCATSTPSDREIITTRGRRGQRWSRAAARAPQHRIEADVGGIGGVLVNFHSENIGASR